MFSSSPAWSLWPAAPRVVPGGHEERAVISGSPRSRAAPSRVVGVLHDAPRQLLGRVVGALRDAPPQLLGRVVGALLDAPPAQLCGGRAACQMPLRLRLGTAASLPRHEMSVAVLLQLVVPVVVEL